VVEGFVGLQGTLLLVFVTLGTINLLADSQSFRMGCGQTRQGTHLRASRKKE